MSPSCVYSCTYHCRSNGMVILAITRDPTMHYRVGCPRPPGNHVGPSMPRSLLCAVRSSCSAPAPARAIPRVAPRPGDHHQRAPSPPRTLPRHYKRVFGVGVGPTIQGWVAGRSHVPRGCVGGRAPVPTPVRACPRSSASPRPGCHWKHPTHRRFLPHVVSAPAIVCVGGDHYNPGDWDRVAYWYVSGALAPARRNRLL
jgi:hypothetical protein